MLNSLEMERYIRATARRADLNVVWKEGITVPTADDKTITLPAMDADMTVEQYKRLLHYVTHEVDHVLYSDSSQLQENGLSAQTSFLGALWNGIEDHRIEFLGSQEYEGDRLNSNDVTADMMHQIAKQGRDIKAKGNPEQLAKSDNLLPFFAWDNQRHADFFPSVRGAQPALEEALTPKGKELLDKYEKGGYDKELRRIRAIEDRKAGTKATLELAKRIFEEVYEQDAEKEMKRAKEEQEKKKKQAGKGAKGQPQEGEGQPGEGQPGQGESEQEGDGEAEQGEGKGKPKANDKFVSIDYSDMMPDAHGVERGAGMHIDYTNYHGSHNYTAPQEQDYRVKNYTDGSAKVNHTGDVNESEIQQAVASTSSGFAHKVRTILQIRERDRYQYGQKRGHLNPSSLHRVIVPDAPGYSSRVFKRKTSNDVLNAAVTLVVDQSGSMGGLKWDHAAAAAVMLNGVIGNVLHIPTEICSFTTAHHHASGTREACAMMVQRQHKDRLVSKDELIARFAQGVRDFRKNNNLDGEAVLWAFDRLMKRKEKRKLLVVFSDGQPAGSGGGDIDWFTHKIVKDIEEQSPVTIVGVGIMDDNVTRIYKENYVINRADGLETALLNLIEGKLK